MGSDAITKSLQPARVGRLVVWTVGVVFTLFFAFSAWNAPTSFPVPPLSSIPPHCQDFASHFYKCQSKQNPRVLVMGCHRKWCNSLWGYCSPGGGVGSRMRYALTIIQRAFEQCVRVEIDAPSTSILTAENAVYRDPMGPFAELLHIRSYGNLVEESRTSWRGNVTEWKSQPSPFYLHFTPKYWISQRPNGMPAFDYDQCLFSLLFQPSPSLQREMDARLDQVANRNTIAIHFRTGDAVAYKNHQEGGDVRISSRNYTQALDQLTSCARELATRLNVDQKNSTTTRPFYLATDNAQVQHVANQRTDVVTFDLQRHSWRHANDFDAWLELFALSKTRGIVANEMNLKNYASVGDRISTFARLAAKIGNMNEEQQVYACQLS